MRRLRPTLFLATTVAAAASLATPALAASPTAAARTGTSGTTQQYVTSAPLEIGGQPGGALIEAIDATDQDGTRRTRVVVDAFAGEAECATDPDSSRALVVRTGDVVRVEAAVEGWCSDGTSFAADVAVTWTLGDVIGRARYDTPPRPSTRPCQIRFADRAATSTGVMTWRDATGTTTTDDLGDARSSTTRWRCPGG